MRALALLISLLPVTAWAEPVRIPGPDGIILNAELFPAQPRAQPGAQAPAVVALHGCSGPFPSHDYDWARRLAAAGSTVLLPDSFGSRGLASQCSARSRPVTASGKRREDALAAARWLAARPGTPPGGVVLLGWSDGGTTALAAGRTAADLPPGLLRGLVAFYPGCRGASEARGWEPAAPLLLLMGEADDWTPAAPCHVLAEKIGPKLTLVTYPGAVHEFDLAATPIHVRPAATTPSGAAHVGSDPAARDDALRRVPAFIAALPPAP